MSRRLTNFLLAAAAVVVPLATFGAIKWREAVRKNGQTAGDAFRIAGNFYFVGTSDVTSFLLTSPEGHVLIDAAAPGSANIIVENVQKLGFKLSDVKAILSTEPHSEHAGAMAELQKASGAQIWASDSTAEALESGGDDPSETFMVFKVFKATGLSGFTPARVDHRVKDGDTVRVGPIALTAHITGGHSIGCITWTFQVREGNRLLNVVDACSLEILIGMKLTDPQRYPGIREDFEKSFKTLRSLPVDIWVTSHGRTFGRYRKYRARDTVADPVAPFIDPEGYRAYIDSSEARFRRELARQQGGR